MSIKFGTSGWRDVIGDKFTFDNVRMMTQAIADYVKEQNAGKKAKSSIIVGYDTRFLSEEFAKTACCVLAANEMEALYCKRDVPTPTISYEIIRNKLDGGINFTASHNPPEYNGLKYSPSWGGPALPEQTKAIEKNYERIKAANSAKTVSFDEGKKKGFIKEIDAEESYLKRIKELVDLSVIKKAKLKIGIDLKWGTGRGYLDLLLKGIGCKPVILHDYRDVLFGGRRPEPDEEGLHELKVLLRKNKLKIGAGVDGDADRFGILDSDGSYITPNDVISVLLYYLVKTRKWSGFAVRSVMTTHLIDAIAEEYGVEVKETPVGFKYIGDHMVNDPSRFIIGGEESGGLTIRGHVPEKDGILACLLMAEMVASEKKSVKQILNTLMKKVGVYITTRINVRATDEIIGILKEKLKSSPPSGLAGLKVKDIVTLDGYKFMLEDNSWVGLRVSGTEPVVRLYIETSSNKKMAELIEAGKALIGVK